MLERHVEAVGDSELDVLVVGGGVHGAWAALEAALRGMRVALVERDDFGGGASANSLKWLHGGFRYVARARPDRVRRFAREQAIVARFAPALVAPLPCLLPTRRRPGRGRPSLWLGLGVYRALRIGLDTMPAPPERLVSREEARRLCPALAGAGHTGGALWHEGQLIDSERLVLALVASSVEAGAVAANYAEAAGFTSRGGRIREVRIRDRLEGLTVTARPRIVYNATNRPPVRIGDWTGAPDPSADDRGMLGITGFNVVVDREISEVALGVEGRLDSEPARRNSGDRRFLFLAPWLGTTLLGTGYLPDEGDDLTPVGPVEVEALLAAFNTVLPLLDLSIDDVTHVHRGRLPAEMSRGAIRPLDRPTLERGGPTGELNLVNVSAPRYSTARLAAVRGIDECERLLDRPVSADRTASLGACDLPHALPSSGPGEGVTAESVERAVATEMAVRLGDLLLRRTNVGAAGVPPSDVVERAAALMGDALGWNRSRRESELKALAEEYAPLAKGHLRSTGRRRGGATGDRSDLRPRDP